MQGKTGFLNSEDYHPLKELLRFSPYDQLHKNVGYIVPDVAGHRCHGSGKKG
jgi:hypothetical protein